MLGERVLPSTASERNASTATVASTASANNNTNNTNNQPSAVNLATTSGAGECVRIALDHIHSVSQLKLRLMRDFSLPLLNEVSIRSLLVSRLI